MERSRNQPESGDGEDEQSTWWSAWREDWWQLFPGASHIIRDPDPDNYARYEPDDELNAVQSNADLAAWFESRRATTAPVSREERLVEIAASEPYTDHDFIRDPETGEVEILYNTPEGVGPIANDGPRILPRTRRAQPRDPSERDIFFDTGDGWFKERAADGSVQPITQHTPDFFN